MRMMSKIIHDSDVRAEALDPARSFIVQAPAGSGKTELLMQRFLTLLATVERPEEILAITFTRKAVGEMRTRIMEALEEAREPLSSGKEHEKRRHDLAQKVLERDSLKKWNLLENPGRLKIQTIDSLCASLARQMPILSRLGRQPAISDTPVELYREAARRTIAMVERNDPDGETLRRTLSHFDNSVWALEEQLVRILERRDQWLRHIRPGMERECLRDALEGSLRRVVEATLRKAAEAFPEKGLEGIMGPARFAASNLQASGKASPIVELAGLVGSPGTRTGELPLWRGLTALLLTTLDTWRKPKGINTTLGFPADKSEEATENKEIFKGILASLSGNDRLLSALIEVGRLPDPEYSDDEWAILNELLSLLPIADHHLTEVFAERGVGDFQAVAMAALDALGPEESPTDLMLSLDLRIQHILVDEYQDTSRRQLELLRALTRGWEPGDGRSLFIVGDPMQSIYLFRDAEVGLFLDAKDSGIGEVRLDTLTLECNFRSQAAIVEWVNDAFQGAFPEGDDPFMGAMRYTPFSSVKPSIEGLTVKTTLFDGRNDSREAEEVVRTIRQIDGSETIAILARSRTHLAAIIEALKREEVDFVSQEIDPLIDRPVTQDLLALLRSLSHPFDRTAWLAILRAPWCGLTLGDLHRLCLFDAESPVWSLINDEKRFSSLSEDGQERLSRFRKAIESALTMRGRLAPRTVLESLWIALGGPACVSDDAMGDADLIFEMVDSAGNGGDIESVELLEARIEKLYATRTRSGENPVEIMTIHKAKGLEFDHVILPGLGKRPRKPDKEILLWLERGDDLLLAPIEKRGDKGGSPIYNYLKGIADEKERLEVTRLFYVAATRARRGLYLFGHTKEIEPDTETVKVEPKSLLARLQHQLEPSMMAVNTACEASPNRDDETSGVPLRLSRLPSPWRSPEPVEAIEIGIEDADIASLPAEPRFDWAGETIRHRGAVLHRYLCRIAREGLTKWDEERITAERSRIETMLLQEGLNRKEAREGSRKGVDILARTIEDSRGRWILGNREVAAAELPVTGIVKGKIVHAVIDRTFVDENRRWIIDYKTGAHEGGSIGEFLEREKERYREQLETYAALLRAGGEEREIRLGLYYPALPGWIEW
ncbi:MAG: UvrD-helicase domain-containing protein [Thermodesulfobacteriota bacterium]